VKKEAAPKKAKAPVEKKDFAAKAPTAKDYTVIIRPMVTEKATLVSAHGQVVFQVSLTASKTDIRDAVQSLFKVQVTGVNTTVRKGKTKAFKGRKAMRGDTKIAYVTLAEGQNIDVAAGI
jgi:large subunit ribosomal protein L23